MSKPSPYSVAVTVNRLQRIIEEKSLKLFAVIDHSGEAARVGLTMPDTKLVLFGSPAAGTPVMVSAPLAALDPGRGFGVLARRQRDRQSVTKP